MLMKKTSNKKRIALVSQHVSLLYFEQEIKICRACPVSDKSTECFFFLPPPEIVEGRDGSPGTGFKSRKKAARYRVAIQQEQPIRPAFCYIKR
jgi:hypothetical protein